jgi:restriction system protein
MIANYTLNKIIGRGKDIIMENEESRFWGIHTLNDNLFLKDNIIAIGWPKMGDLALVEANREAFKEKYVQVYPEAKKGNIATSAGMLYRFCHEVQIGDYVVFPSKINREVNIGVIEGEYIYDSTQEEYVQTRKVKWLKHMPRMAFSQGALYEIGSAMTFFSVKNYAEEFLGALNNEFKKSLSSDAEDESVGATADDIIENTKDFILKELSRQLKGYDLEEFVADLLGAMGYRTIVSPHGGDSGIDITAYKDELPPRILVQVKSQDSDIKEATIQSLKGAMREGDYGLFVTLSNYTKNAQKYLETTPIIRGINGTELVELILKYYDNLSVKYKKMIPLKMVYIPISKSE